MTSTLLLLSLLAPPQAQAPAPRFDDPVRLTAGDAPIKVEQPGFAAPCWHDVDRDGEPDLVVGQFHDGKMNVFKGLGGGRLAPGEWLEAEGDVAEVPGVW